jgi:hypothetical protein
MSSLDTIADLLQQPRSGGGEGGSEYADSDEVGAAYHDWEDEFANYFRDNPPKNAIVLGGYDDSDSDDETYGGRVVKQRKMPSIPHFPKNNDTVEALDIMAPLRDSIISIGDVVEDSVEDPQASSPVDEDDLFASIATSIVTKKDGRNTLKSWHDLAPATSYRPTIENYSLDAQLYNNPFNTYEGGGCGCEEEDAEENAEEDAEENAEEDAEEDAEENAEEDAEENAAVGGSGIMQFVLSR